VRTNSTLRKLRPVHLGAAVAMLAIPASAVALAAGNADALSAIQITLKTAHLGFGHPVVVSGSAPGATAGAPLQLQFAPTGATRWQELSSGATRAGGRFRFVQPVRQSGLLRVVPGQAGTAPRVAAQFSATGAAPLAPSAPHPVSVAARFAVPARSLAVLGGGPAHVRGKLLPALAGRQVRLLGHSAQGWRALSTGRTGPRGGFDLPVRASGSGQRWLRVGFSGDRHNAGSWAHAGSVTAFRQSLASWYNDGGATACGFHARYGVANKSLPCGTKVAFRAGGRSVTAVVDDRGPYVGGREWDLNQNTAGALGFGGVGMVWSSS
jgi:rare lipoprotein A